MFLLRERYLLKGYGRDDRIVYGTGRIVPSAQVGEAAASIWSAATSVMSMRAPRLTTASSAASNELNPR